MWARGSAEHQLKSEIYCECRPVLFFYFLSHSALFSHLTSHWHQSSLSSCPPHPSFCLLRCDFFSPYQSVHPPFSIYHVYMIVIAHLHSDSIKTPQAYNSLLCHFVSRKHWCLKQRGSGSAQKNKHHKRLALHGN